MVDTERSSKSMLERLHDALISPGGRLLRYLLVLVAIGSAIWLSLIGWFRICETVDSAKDGVTTTCSPPDLTNAGVLAAVLLVLLLLWPDLSEFSAFGVTVKKLVQDVKRKVTENGRGIGRIDSAASDIDRQVRLTLERLDAIQISVAALGPTLQPEMRGSGPTEWESIDADQLTRIARTLLEPGELEARRNDLLGLVESQGPTLAVLDTYDRWVHLFGQLIALQRTLTQRRGSRSENRLPGDGRQGAVEDLLRLVDRLIVALVSGQRLDYDLVLTAIAVEWHLVDRQL